MIHCWPRPYVLTSFTVGSAEMNVITVFTFFGVYGVTLGTKLHRSDSIQGTDYIATPI